MESLKNAKAPSAVESEPFSAEKYYSTQPAPAHLEDTLEGVRKFVDANTSKGRRVVLVTVSNARVQMLSIANNGPLVRRNHCTSRVERVSNVFFHIT